MAATDEFMTMPFNTLYGAKDKAITNNLHMAT